MTGPGSHGVAGGGIALAKKACFSLLWRYMMEPMHARLGSLARSVTAHRRSCACARSSVPVEAWHFSEVGGQRARRAVQPLQTLSHDRSDGKLPDAKRYTYISMAAVPLARSRS